MQTPAPVNLDDPSLYLNRELSWLQFNRRVLEEAQDPTVPLLERVKFLAIFTSNLDEFFMVRVGGLQQKVQAGFSHGSGGDKLTPSDQLARIGDTVRELVAEQYRCLNAEVLPALRDKGIVIRGQKELTPDDLRNLREYFRARVFPVLTPLAVDPGHPFPHLANKSLNLAVLLRRPGDPDPLFAVVQVPAVLPRLVDLTATSRGADFGGEPRLSGVVVTPDGRPPVSEIALTPLETAIRLHLSDLFPGMELLQTACFRVTRDSEFELDEEVEDLLRAIEENVRQRRRGHAVRLEIEADAPAEIEQQLAESLDLAPADVTRVPGMLDLTGLFQVHALPGFPDLRDPPFVPVPVKEFALAPSLWSAIKAKDILLHHPYESFKYVVEFIETAADDDRVLAIKQTLYRTSSDSPVVKALQRAADRGKQVTAVIELKARLDEERNILWAKELEKSGVHVVFGFVGLKTHCKVALVVRREDDGIRRYVHLGTGNYNPQTARIYTDLGFFTTNPDFADDVTLLFNYLTGYAELPQWRKLIVAPSRMLAFFLEKIDREIANQKAGKKARIAAKLNGLLEPKIVQALYRASQAGVRIDMVCRGVCALRPGVPGMSENGPGHVGGGPVPGAQPGLLLRERRRPARCSSARPTGWTGTSCGGSRWSSRSSSRTCGARPIDEVLAISFADTVKARELLPDGSYRRVRPAEGQPGLRSQQRFQELAAEAERRLAGPVVAEPTPLLGANGAAVHKVVKCRPKREV